MIKKIIFLFFNRERFICLAKQRNEEILREQNERDKNRHAGQVDKTPNYETHTTTVRKAVVHSLLMVFSTVLIGYVIGWLLEYFIDSPSRTISRTIQYSGIGILLWATLGKCGWNIQTAVGTTLPEQVNDILFRALYMIGSFLLVVSGTWSASYWS